MSPMMKAYYATGKRVMIDGVPCWRPKWYGELGNDREFKEATKLRTNPKHYVGWHRIVIDGVPCRVAEHVKKWKASNRAALGQGYDPFGLTLIPRTKRGYLDYDPAQKVVDHYRLNEKWDRNWKLQKRLAAERELNKWQKPPDLFVWARWEAARKLARQVVYV